MVISGIICKIMVIFEFFPYYYYYSFILPSRIGTIYANLIMRVYLLSLFSFLFWPYWLYPFFYPLKA